MKRKARWFPAAAIALALTPAAAEMPLVREADARSATPQMFGAVGDGLAVETDAVTAWLNSGRPLSCTGVFRIDQPVRVSLPVGRGLFLQGHGRHLCRIVLTGQGRIQIEGSLPPGADLTANALHGASQIVIRDLGIEPAYAMAEPAGERPQTGAALSIGFPGKSAGNPGGWTDPMLVIDNVSILPADTKEPTYAHYGLYLSNVSNAEVANVTCEGRRGPIVPGSACIVYEGDGAPVDTRIRNVHAYFVETGIRLSGTWQGVHILTPTIVATRFGITASATDNESTLLEVSGGEINVSDAAIMVQNTTRTFIHDVHLNLFGVSTRPDPACVKLAMTSRANAQFTIHDTICEAYQGQALSGIKYGVHLSTALPLGSQRTSGIIHGNLFSNAGKRDPRFTPIHLGQGTSDIVVGCNEYRGATGEPGTGNVENLNSGENPRFLNYMACATEPLPPGLSAGRR